MPLFKHSILTTRQRPVSRLLSILVLACLLPGAIGLLVFLVNEYREERQRSTEESQQIARSLVENQDQQMRRTAALARALARSDELAAGDMQAFARHAAPLMAALSANGQVFVYRHDGTRADAPPGTAARLGAVEQEALRTGFEGRSTFASDLFVDTVSARPVVASYVPVFRQGRVGHVLAVVVPATITSTLLAARHLPEGWLGSLLDRCCTIVGRTRAADRFVGQKAAGNLCQAIARGASGSLETVTRDGIENLTVFHRSAQTGYTTVVGIPREQLVKPLQARLAYLGATAFALFGLGLFLARRMSRRIADSIQALIEPASALGQGKSLAIRSVRVSEVAEVGDAIARAASLLQERDAALQAQRDELQQFKFFSENANEMLLLLDEQGNIRYANRMTSEVLGYANAELLSMTLFQIDLPTTPDRLQFVFARCREAQPPAFERVYRCKDGTDVPVEITATVLEHKGEWLMHVAPRDIRERRQAEQALRWAAAHDGLTRLANRAHATQFLERALAQVRAGQARGALLFLDLDRFKPVNDLHGHEVGDRVLHTIARRLETCVREGELLARVGGDEFLFILPDLAQAHTQAAERAAALIEAISSPVSIGNIEVRLSTSIGISRFPEDGDTASALVHAADMAMLQVKQDGRAGYAYYSSAMDEQAQFTLSIERRLQSALEGRGLALHYQPIIALASGRIDGVEALIRLEDGVAPAVGPGVFVPIAESSGLISPIGQWVAREACRQQASWQNEGLPLNVSVNVSALQFRRSGFVDQVRGIIEATGIHPRHLVIELTETSLMENIEEAVGILHAIKALGVRIALDDFGTGYSSLSILSALPVDKLKIDQSFVRAIETDHASRAVIDAVIALANSLGLELVAEGIETEAALDYLRQRGCQLGQGYYFSRPLAPAQLVQWCSHQEGLHAV